MATAIAEKSALILCTISVADGICLLSLLSSRSGRCKHVDGHVYLL